MVKPDVRLGEQDVEVVGERLVVTESDGDGDEGLRIRENGVKGGTKFYFQRSGVQLPPSEDASGNYMLADGFNARTSISSPQIAVQEGEFVEAVFGGDPVSGEEPVGGRIEVRDAGNQVAVLLDGERGVVESPNGDIAEYFPNGTGTAFDGGTVVGLDDGVVTDDPTAGDEAFVVATDPMVLGNRPSDPTADEHVPLALLGQVPVRIAAPVEAGDRLVATTDGRAVPTDAGSDGAPFVGRALDAAAASAETTTALVGRPPGDAARSRPEDGEHAGESATGSDGASTANRVATLEAENEALREQVTQLEARLSALESESAAAPQSADD